MLAIVTLSELRHHPRGLDELGGVDREARIDALHDRAGELVGQHGVVGPQRGELAQHPRYSRQITRGAAHVEFVTAENDGTLRVGHERPLSTKKLEYFRQIAACLVVLARLIVRIGVGGVDLRERGPMSQRRIGIGERAVRVETCEFFVGTPQHPRDVRLLR